MMISFLFWLVDDPDILIKFVCPICFYDHVAGFCWFSGLSFSHFCWGGGFTGCWLGLAAAEIPEEETRNKQNLDTLQNGFNW